MVSNILNDLSTYDEIRTSIFIQNNPEYIDFLDNNVFGAIQRR